MEQSLLWMNAAFGLQQTRFVDSRGRWLGLVFLGLIALAWPLSALLPAVAEAPVGANLAWRPLLIAAIAPALLTPLILWKAPTEFLPILLGDYLTLHFLLYGILTMAVCAYFATPSNRLTSLLATSPGLAAAKRIALVALAIAAYNILAFGLPIDAYVTSFLPIPSRIPLIVAIACGALPYFIADEWLTRGVHPRRGAYALTKLCFLLSLAIAVALNPMKLFFLAIIVPAILLLFLAFGLIARWSYRATNHPLPGALANAAVFAWGIAVTFPMIAR